MSIIHFQGDIRHDASERARIRSAIERVDAWDKTEAAPRWVVLMHDVSLGDKVYVAHAVMRDWTVTASTVAELEDKLTARAEGGPESSRAVQPSPFRTE